MKFLSTAASVTAFVSLAAAQMPAAPVVQKIAPKATACKTDECRTAEQAAPWLAQGMAAHGVYDVKEMASILALVALESGEFQYKRNAFPGRPGQGTVNMQNAHYNLLYVRDIPAIDSTPFKDLDFDTVSKWAADEALYKQHEKEMNAILEPLLEDKYNFASGAWFLATQCKEARAAFKTSADEGFKAHMKCVGVTIDESRQAYFDRAKEAFGI